MEDTSANIRRFESEIFLILQAFDKAQEWADLSNCLGRLHKVLIKYDCSLASTTCTELVAQRLSECLHPSLPAGVHSKCLDVYSQIFLKFDENYFCNNLGLWSSGLFPIFADSASHVKPVFLKIISTYYVPLKDKLLPCLTGLLIALLPGLDTVATPSLVDLQDILLMIQSCVGTKEFVCSLWIVALRTCRVRLPALQLMISIFDNTTLDTDIVFPYRDTLVMNTISALFHDDSILVQRQLFDLLIKFVPFSSDLFNSEQKTTLLYHALYVYSLSESSIERRLMTWITNEDKLLPEEKQLTYFEKYVKTILEQALIMHFNAPLKEKSSLPDNVIRPFKIIQALFKETEYLQKVFSSMQTHFLEYINSLSDDLRAHVVKILINLINSSVIDSKDLYNLIDCNIEKFECSSTFIDTLNLSLFFINNVLAKPEKYTRLYRLIEQMLKAFHIFLVSSNPKFQYYDELFSLLRINLIELKLSEQSLNSLLGSMTNFFSDIGLYIRLNDCRKNYESIFDLIIFAVYVYKMNSKLIPVDWLLDLYTEACNELEKPDKPSLIKLNLFMNVYLSLDLISSSFRELVHDLNLLQQNLWNGLTDLIWGDYCAQYLLHLSKKDVVVDDEKQCTLSSKIQKILVNELSKHAQKEQCIAFKKFTLLWFTSHKLYPNDYVIYDGMIVALDCLDSSIPALQSMCSLWVSTSLTETLGHLLDPLYFKLLNLDLKVNDIDNWRFEENYDTNLASFILSKIITVVQTDSVSFIAAADATLPLYLLNLYEKIIKPKSDSYDYLNPGYICSYLDVLCVLASRFLLTGFGDKKLNSKFSVVQSSAASLLKVLVVQALPHMTYQKQFCFSRCLIPVCLKAFSILNYNAALMCQCLDTFIIIYPTVFEVQNTREIHTYIRSFTLDNDSNFMVADSDLKLADSVINLPEVGKESACNDVIQQIINSMNSNNTSSNGNILEKTGNLKVTPKKNGSHTPSVYKSARLQQAKVFNSLIECSNTIIPSILKLSSVFCDLKDSDIINDSLINSYLNKFLLLINKTMTLIPATHPEYQFVFEKLLLCIMNTINTTKEHLPAYSMLKGLNQVLKFLFETDEVDYTTKHSNATKTSIWLTFAKPEVEQTEVTPSYRVLYENFQSILKTLATFSYNHLDNYCTSVKNTNFSINNFEIDFKEYNKNMINFGSLLSNTITHSFERLPSHFLLCLGQLSEMEFNMIVTLMERTKTISIRQIFTIYMKFFDKTYLSSVCTKECPAYVDILSQIYKVLIAFRPQFSIFVDADWKALAKLILGVLAYSSENIYVFWTFAMLHFINKNSLLEENVFSDIRVFGQELNSIARRFVSIGGKMIRTVAPIDINLSFVKPYIYFLKTVSPAKDAIFTKYPSSDGSIITELDELSQWAQLVLSTIILLAQDNNEGSKPSYLYKNFFNEIGVYYLEFLLPLFQKYLGLLDSQYRYLLMLSASSVIKFCSAKTTKETISDYYYNFLINYKPSTNETLNLLDDCMTKHYFLLNLDRQSFRLLMGFLKLKINSQTVFDNIIDRISITKSSWFSFKRDEDNIFISNAQDIKKLNIILLSSPIKFITNRFNFLVDYLTGLLSKDKKRSTNELILCEQVLLCLRIILFKCRNSPNISRLWPPIFLELGKISFDKAIKETNLTLHLLKFVDLAILLNIPEFHLNQWIFVQDSLIDFKNDKAYKPLCSRMNDASTSNLNFLVLPDSRKPLIYERTVDQNHLYQVISRLNNYAVKSCIQGKLKFDVQAILVSIENDILNCSDYILDWQVDFENQMTNFEAS